MAVICHSSDRETVRSVNILHSLLAAAGCKSITLGRGIWSYLLVRCSKYSYLLIRLMQCKLFCIVIAGDFTPVGFDD